MRAGKSSAGCGAIERSITVGCIVGAGGAIERLSTGRRVVDPGGVAIESFKTVGGIVAAGCVLIERLITVGGIVAAGCVVKERVSTDGGVAKTGGEEVKRKITLGGVVIGIGSIRCRANCMRRLQKRKGCEHYGNE